MTAAPPAIDSITSEDFELLTRDAHDRVRERAYQVSQNRGPRDPCFDDWTQAERELFVSPPTRLVRTPERYLLTVNIAGFPVDRIEVVKSGNTVLITGSPCVLEPVLERRILFDDTAGRRLYREVGFPDDADMSRLEMSGSLTGENGVIEIEIPIGVQVAGDEASPADRSGSEEIGEPSGSTAADAPKESAPVESRRSTPLETPRAENRSEARQPTSPQIEEEAVKVTRPTPKAPTPRVSASAKSKPVPPAKTASKAGASAKAASKPGVSPAKRPAVSASRHDPEPQASGWRRWLARLRGRK